MSGVELVLPGVVSFGAAEALIGGQDARAQARDQQVRDEVERALQEAAQTAQQSEQAAALEADIAKAREAVSNLQAAPATGTTSITRDGAGNVVVQTADGKRIVIGEGIVPPGAIEGIVASMAPPPPPPPFEQGPPENVIKLVALVFSFVTLILVVGILARTFGRRADRRVGAAVVPPDLAARLERIEQSVDAVAVEVERVSEAQRYAARLLTERLPETLPQLAGAPATG